MSTRFVRFLATAAKTVKPPVQLYGLDGTYATALYTAAVKKNTIESSFRSVTKLAETIKEDPKVLQILANPSLSQNSRKDVVAALTTQLSLEPTVSNLLNVLAENNRLDLFEGVAKQFSILNDAHNGVVEARVVSAKPLDARTLTRLSRAISGSKYVGRGQTLHISNEVDTSILGGLIVEVGEKSVDLSVQSKVTKLNKVLTEAI